MLLLFSACETKDVIFLANSEFIKKHQLDGIWGDEKGERLLILNSNDLYLSNQFNGYRGEYITDPIKFLNTKRDSVERCFLWLNEGKPYYVCYKNASAHLEIGQLYKYNLDCQLEEDTSFYADINDFFKTKDTNWQTVLDSSILGLYLPDKYRLCYVYSLIPNDYKTPICAADDVLTFWSLNPHFNTLNCATPGKITKLKDKFILSISNDKNQHIHFFATAFDQVEEKVQMLTSHGKTKEVIFRPVLDTFFDLGKKIPTIIINDSTLPSIEGQIRYDSFKLATVNYAKKMISYKYKYIPNF